MIENTSSIRTCLYNELKTVSIMLVLAITSLPVLAQQQPMVRMGNLDISSTGTSTDNKKNPIKIENYDIFSLNSFDIWGLAAARALTMDLDFDIDVENHLHPSTATSNDPWERRAAEKDFLDRFEARISHIQEINPYAKFGFQIPLAFTSINMDEYVFQMLMPNKYSTQAFLRSEPYAIGQGATVHLGWNIEGERVSLNRMRCGSRTHGRDATQPIPRSFRGDIYNGGHCAKLPMPNESIARIVYEHATVQPFVLQAKCSTILPFATNRRTGGFEGHIVCVIKDAKIEQNDGKTLAEWQSENKVWEYVGGSN